MDASIIIPVFNDLKAVQSTLKSIRNQNVSSELTFEIIIIDNGSTDGSDYWLKQQKDIVFLSETQMKGSPYSCRNRGIEIAKGDFIILLDATCVPDENWLTNGLTYARGQNHILFGGRVKFNFEGRPTAGKIYDSISNIRMEFSIKYKKQAKTANLWIHRSIFEDAGKFREGVRSGEDLRWTGHCKRKGIPLEYCGTAIVYKYTRSTKELLKKQVRVGKGQISLWNSQGTLKANLAKSLKKILPLKPATLKKLIKSNEDVHCTKILFLKIYIVSYIAGIATLGGNFIRLFKIN